jgi:hypothetical protein
LYALIFWVLPYKQNDSDENKLAVKEESEVGHSASVKGELVEESLSQCLVVSCP